MKDFTTERAQDEVEFYMGIVVEEEESFEGLIEHLHDAFKSGKTHSKLISDFCGESQKTRETEDTFADDLQELARKIIVCKPSFCQEANNQLKAQYMHKLWDSYYAAMAHSTLQSSPEEETFTRFWGCLVTIFGGHTKQSTSSVTSRGINAKVSQIEDTGSKLLKNYRQHKNKIYKQEAQINSLQNQNDQLRGLLHPKLLVNIINQAVTTSLKVNSQPASKGGARTNGTCILVNPI